MGIKSLAKLLSDEAPDVSGSVISLSALSHFVLCCFGENVLPWRRGLQEARCTTFILLSFMRETQ